MVDENGNGESGGTYTTSFDGLYISPRFEEMMTKAGHKNPTESVMELVEWTKECIAKPQEPKLQFASIRAMKKFLKSVNDDPNMSDEEKREIRNLYLPTAS